MQQSQKPFSESGSSPPIRVTLSRVNIVPSSTVGTGIGIDAEGKGVCFVADWRPCLALAELLRAGRKVEVTVSGCQIICWDSGRQS